MNLPDPPTDANYKPIGGFPGYIVGDDGSVWSCRPRNGAGKLTNWRKLKGVPQHDGHLRVTLRPAHANVFVHKLVIEAFVGPAPAGMECCHEDGNPGNNRLSNLRWDTHSANQLDAVRHGTHVDNGGSKHPMAKLGEVDIPLIRGQLAKGMSRAYIAAIWNVSETTISRIATRAKVGGWSHVA